MSAPATLAEGTGVAAGATAADGGKGLPRGGGAGHGAEAETSRAWSAACAGTASSRRRMNVTASCHVGNGQWAAMHGGGILDKGRLWEADMLCLVMIADLLAADDDGRTAWSRFFWVRGKGVASVILKEWYT